MIDIALNRSYTANKGLVLHLDDRGWPVRDGVTDAMDATILEARRFYDTLKSPDPTPVMTNYPDPDTGAAPAMKQTAPLTFAAWKAAFHFPPRNDGESLADYRQRADVVVYYNKNELGLGRELACTTFNDGQDSAGQALTGVACYVTNYGTAFRDVVNSLPLAIDGTHPKNTVCISYRPSLGAGYEVQFYTFNSDGDRREWAQLDTLGPRPLPQVCMNCHGGSYDDSKHLAKFARFLPLDPNVVVFADAGTPGGVSRADEEERIRKVNLLGTMSPLTDAQKVMLDKLYGGNIATAGTTSATEWAPDAWNDSPEHRALFDKVIKPNCATCHSAMQSAPDGSVLPISESFRSPALLDAGLPAFLCGGFTMPNSQATLLNFWEPAAAPIAFPDGSSHASAADLMLSQLHMTRDQCASLTNKTSCNRGSDPEAMCGNAFSGRACNRTTGECMPKLHAPRKPGDPNGVCKTDGSRKCTYPEKCVAGNVASAPGVTSPEGIVGYDGVCMP